VLPHRDSKDVFILGGIDDIQALLDDSMVKILLMYCVEHTGHGHKRVILLLSHNCKIGCVLVNPLKKTAKTFPTAIKVCVSVLFSLKWRD